MATGTEIVKGNGYPSRTVPALQALTVENIWMMAQQVAESKLFPNVNTPQQAFTLMLLCQADGLHPMHALRRYHIIQGRPRMRSDAVQAEFQADGGKIEIIRCDEQEARALFSHPIHHPKPVEMSYTIEQAWKAGLTAGTWKTHPADMLWARLVTKGVTRVHPGIVAGISTPEEVQDAVVVEAAHEVVKQERALPPQQEAPRGDWPVPGQPSSPNGLDPRPFARVVTDAVAEVNAQVAQDAAGRLDGEIPENVVKGVTNKDVYNYLFNDAMQHGWYTEARPEKLQHAVAILAKLYEQHRDVMREAIGDCLGLHVHWCDEAIAMAQERRGAVAAQDASELGDEPMESLPAGTGATTGTGARQPSDEG